MAVLPAQSSRIDDAALKRAGQSGDDWLTYGLNQSETRFSPLKEIDTTNVTRLGLAWSFDLMSGGGGQEATPLVANGTIYAITNWSVVIRRGRAHGQGEMAMGSVGEPDRGASGDLLRRRQSRPGDLSGDDLRARSSTAGSRRSTPRRAR